MPGWWISQSLVLTYRPTIRPMPRGRRSTRTPYKAEANAPTGIFADTSAGLEVMTLLFFTYTKILPSS